MEKGKGQDVRDAREKEGSTRSVEVILQSIENRLTKIEKQNLPQTNTYRETRPPNGSYTVTTKQNTIDDRIYDSLKFIVTYYLIQTDNVFKKEKKEITIRISNETKRCKIYKEETKKLVKKIKKIVFKLIRVNKIKNRDIKITILIKKVKIIFLKDIK